MQKMSEHIEESIETSFRIFKTFDARRKRHAWKRLDLPLPGDLAERVGHAVQDRVLQRVVGRRGRRRGRPLIQGVLKIRVPAIHSCNCFCFHTQIEMRHFSCARSTQTSTYGKRNTRIPQVSEEFVAPVKRPTD